MKKNSILLFIIIFYSCCNNNYQEKEFAFNEMKYLSAEKVVVEEILIPDFITKTKDFLFIASSKSDTVLHTYSLPDLNHQKSDGTHGAGPNEFQAFPMFCESNADSLVYIWGYTPLIIKKYSVNADGDLILEKEHLLNLYESFNNMHIINDSLFIYYLPDNLCIKKHDLSNNKLIDKIDLQKDNHKESYFYSNRGVIAVNDSSIIYAYLFKKQIDIYDLNTMKLRTVIKDNKKYEKPKVGDFENTIQYYTSIVLGEKYFYVLYHGTSVFMDNKEIIEVYDYEANSIIKYTFDTPPFLFVVDEAAGYIYGYNPKQEDALLKYKL
jgi:hypothetical protein